MAHITASSGACPVCGNHVARTIHVRAGVARESFHCPDHGRLSYAPGEVPLADLSHRFQAAPAIVTVPSAQMVTGLDLIA